MCVCVRTQLALTCAEPRQVAYLQQQEMLRQQQQQLSNSYAQASQTSSTSTSVCMSSY